MGMSPEEIYQILRHGTDFIPSVLTVTAALSELEQGWLVSSVSGATTRRGGEYWRSTQGDLFLRTRPPRRRFVRRSLIAPPPLRARPARIRLLLFLWTPPRRNGATCIGGSKFLPHGVEEREEESIRLTTVADIIPSAQRARRACRAGVQSAEHRSAPPDSHRSRRSRARLRESSPFRRARWPG